MSIYQVCLEWESGLKTWKLSKIRKKTLKFVISGGGGGKALSSDSEVTKSPFHICPDRENM